MYLHEESTLFFQGGWVIEGETRDPPEVLFIFPQSSVAEAPKDQVMILVVSGVLDGHVP